MLAGTALLYLPLPNFFNKATTFTKTDNGNISEQKNTKETGVKLSVNIEAPPKKTIEKQEQLSNLSLIEGSAYATLFKNDEFDFTNMSTNELHYIVKTANDMDREYTQKFGSEEPVRRDQAGNPIISRKREEMLNLESKLNILSFGGGNVDPDEKINIKEYLTTSSKQSDNEAKNYPERSTYQVRASYMKEIIKKVPTLNNTLHIAAS
ncbi:hypothetical protein [Pseudoalteromonas arctica]|uniref:Uncharacterized protein n=1 Tax=Pseudoalteromonas arctica TaxID=394751 RepID=A0A7Y0HAR2_9GAMM|nr:hypothetical protein [Pseudoalteromonas arctica]NMM40896.1 hypothetical protein [Pseudoalteromonas arctica]